MQDKRSWLLVLLFMGILVVSSLPQPVTAFKVIDHAMCKGVAFRPKAATPPTCEQRTNEFLLTDELAYLWVRGSLEKSDLGAELEFKFYDPDDHVFPTSFASSPLTAKESGEIAIWMGIGIVKANNTGGLVDLGGNVEIRGVFGRAQLGPGGSVTWRTAIVPGQYAAASKPGQWRAEFTLDGRVVVSERFTVAPAVFLHLKDVKYEPSAASKEPFYVGDVGSVTYVLENTGVAVAKNVEIKVVNVPSGIEIVDVTAPKDLKPAATDEWQLKLKASKPGSYEIRVSFYIDGSKVNFKVPDEKETVNEFKVSINASEKPFLQAYGLYIAGGVAALVVVIVVVLLMMRRKGGRAAAPAPVTIPPAAPIPTPAPVAPSIAPPPTPPSPSNFCINCGAPMPETSRFCPKCGSQQP